MKHRIPFACLLFPAVCCLCFQSCSRKIESNPSWNAEVLAPLLKSTLTLDDLLADSLLQTNPDHSVSLVFSSDLYTASLSDASFQIPDTAITESISLGTINLSDKTITYPYSLGAMCLQLDLLGQLIIASNGLPFAIPPISGLSTPPNDLDATAFFQSADIESGSIDLSLQNGLPLTMSTIIFQVKNKIDQQVITQDTFQNLLPNTTQTKTIDLAGKHVEGTLQAIITDMESPGGTFIIDTSDAIVITLVAHDITVDSATAIFPAQNLIDDDAPTTYQLSGGAELNTLRLKSGTLKITVKSTIPQESHFEYSLPSVHDGLGNSISLSHDLSPAPQNGTSEFSQSFDLSGYTFDLTGTSGTEHNTFYSHLVASIDSTGTLETISKQDSIYISYELTGIEPDYLSGYMGQQIVTVNDTSAFTVFKNIKSGQLSLEDVDVSMNISNGIGVQGRINLYNLTSINSSTGTQVPLTWSELGKPLELAAATDNPFIPSSTSFELNNTNSNVAALLSNLPDQLGYSLDVFINPYGNSSNYHDFAYDSSELNTGLDVSVPLSLVAQNLVLVDTLDFSIGSSESGDATIKDGTFNLIVNNGFPISATTQLYFYDDDFNLKDSLFTSAQPVAASMVTDQCLVSGKTQSVLTLTIDEAKMQRLKSARKVILVSTFNTATHPGCNYLKIYDSYSMDIQLTGLFNYYTGY